ncbi:CsbD family protein [Lapidilactobacillus achengensis]|uniref:CsbD family protein n=1 Tax=Lapidilactobacillus achengensis TaxID=2486000 RepID=A0ABW1UPL8_9LACO|nr:CsbD family protein [Lapidilactobacillus achengensis]
MSFASEKDQVKGKLNETVGKVTNNDQQELKGKAQAATGKAKEKLDQLAENVAEKVNEKLDQRHKHE